MTYRPRVGDYVATPDGSGIVIQTVGTPTGSGVQVFLTTNPTPEGRSPPIYDVGEIEQCAPPPPFEVGDHVVIPGGYAGQVIDREDDIAVCRYESRRPRVSRHGQYRDWQLHISTLRGH